MAFLFQDWQVYKDARALRKEISVILKTYPSEEKFALTDQTRRAMLSVMLQIAEGSNRRTEKDKVVFINRSFTSLYEVLACFDCSLDDGYISQEHYKILYEKIENIAKQLKGLEKHLSGPK
jgi:four helix bundle protein